jgi:Alcohol dehydrogenase GroES-like domain
MDKETGMGLALSLIDEDASAAGFAGATTAATMMAIVHRRYGRPDVLEHTEVDKPVVGDDDVLVRVHAAAVHPGDYFIMTGVPTVVRLAFGLRRPRNGIRGMDVAGRVEAVGRSVQGLEPGDAVFGRSSTGTLAEYTRAPADNFAPKRAALFSAQRCYCAARKPRSDSCSTLMICMPITIGGIDGMHTVVTEIGENTSIQPQLITPPTTSLFIWSRRLGGRCASVVPARQTTSLLGRKRHQVGQRFLIISDDFDIPRVIAIKLLRPFEVTYMWGQVSRCRKHC